MYGLDAIESNVGYCSADYSNYCTWNCDVGDTQMIKAIVVAKDFSQYATYLRNRKFSREEYGYFNNYAQVIGLNKNTKVLWLEGWRDNKFITHSDIKHLTTRFHDHAQVSEVWIYGEGSFI